MIVFILKVPTVKIGGGGQVWTEETGNHKREYHKIIHFYGILHITKM